MTTIPNYGAALPKQFQNTGTKDIKKLYISSLFSMIILAPSGAGKSNLLIHLLKSADNVFRHLHMVCRNPNQPLYDWLRERLNGFITFHDPESFPSVNHIRANPSKYTVESVVFDDLSSDKIIQKNNIAPFFIRCRHMKLSCLFLAHSYFGTEKLIRLNTHYNCLLKASGKRDMRMIIKDMDIATSEENFCDAYRRATASKGQFLFTDALKSQLRYNFDQVVDLNTLEGKKISD